MMMRRSSKSRDLEVALYPHPSTHWNFVNQISSYSSTYLLPVFKGFIVVIINVTVYHALQAGKSLSGSSDLSNHSFLFTLPIMRYMKAPRTACKHTQQHCTCLV
jgi:hypothetical protein